MRTYFRAIALGVPEITSIAAPIDRPVGSPMAEKTAPSPSTSMAWLYGTPKVAFTSVPVAGTGRAPVRGVLDATKARFLHPRTLRHIVAEMTEPLPLRRAIDQMIGHSCRHENDEARPGGDLEKDAVGGGHALTLCGKSPPRNTTKGADEGRSMRRG